MTISHLAASRNRQVLRAVVIAAAIAIAGCGDDGTSGGGEGSGTPAPMASQQATLNQQIAAQLLQDPGLQQSVCALRDRPAQLTELVKRAAGPIISELGGDPRGVADAILWACPP